MIPIKTESAWRGTSDCRHCGIRDMVLFADLNEQDFSAIHTPIDDLELKKGSMLFDRSSRSHGIYTLRTGMVKLVRVTADGRQRIVRVLRPGDVVGLEVLTSPCYDSDAVALTDVSVCRIPVEVILKLGANSQRLHLKLMQKWQQTVRDADDWLADLNFGTARQRVSSLILKMRSPADLEITTLFSRDDMGAMLDLKMETVSREINQLVREGVIEQLDRMGRAYRVRQPEKLLQG
jgi:CRP-like cAMP-binding protein